MTGSLSRGNGAVDHKDCDPLCACVFRALSFANDRAAQQGKGNALILSRSPMTSLRPTVFLDRDGIVNIDTGYPHRADELVLTPTAAQAIARLNRSGCLVIVVTNQSGVARGLFDLVAVDDFHTTIQRELAQMGGHIDAFYVAPWHPAGVIAEFAIDHPDRKPGAGMILRAMAEWPVDRIRAILFGDKASDIEAASRAGIPAERLASDTCDLDAAVTGWLDRLGLNAQGPRTDKNRDAPNLAE